MRQFGNQFRIGGSRSRTRRVVVSVILFFLPEFAHGTNGLNLIGFGAESILMGGADLAVARDTSALNTNPAGLTQIQSRALDAQVAVAHALDVAHRDRFGNNEDVANDPVGFANFGYAQRLSGMPITVGIGLFAQGGAGYVYENLNTAFGTRDDLSALFGAVKLTPGASYEVSDALSLGASIGIVYATAKQDIFSDTSIFNAATPAQSFFGFKLRDARALNAGLKLGVQYKIDDKITLGAAYTSKTRLPLEKGKLTVNFSAIGLGEVTYRDVSIEGLALPREVGAGIAWRPAPELLISPELNWLNWNDALNASTLSASKPEHPAAPPELRNTARLDWRDQYVVALGLAYRLSDKTTLLAGYNYGRNPVPRQTTNPLLATIARHHLLGGFERCLSAEWQVIAGLEYDPATEVTYTNSELPFGVNAQERGEVVAVHFTLNRRW